MNKRIRSRVLAAGMVSSTFLGLGAFPYLQQAVLAQDKPSAAEQLDRASRLYDQKQYAEAKKVLLDIDPAQLPEDQRNKLADLVKNTDVALSQSQGANATFDSAQADLDSDKLAAAASGFQSVIDDSTASSDLKDKAKIQLALVRQKQADKAPQMKELLNQAETLYQNDKLDEAQNALNTIQATGSDLGWQDNAKPAQLQQKINERRAALASAQQNAPAPAAVAAAPAAEAPAPAAEASAPATGSALAAATEATPAEPAPAAQPAAPAPMPPAPVAPSGAAAAEVAPTGSPVTPTGVGANNAPAPSALPAAPQIPAGVNPNSPLGQTITADEIARQRALTLYNIALHDSDAALHATPPQYQVAVDRAHEAGTIIQNNRQYFSDTEADSLAARATSLESQAKNARDTYASAEAAREAAQAHEAEIRLANLRSAQRHARVDALMRDAKRFVETMQYKEAADTLRQILIIDPTNSSAELMLSLVNDRIAYRAYEKLTRTAAREEQRQRLQDQEEVIPYADLLVYPENWVELSRNRLGEQSEQQSAASRAAYARLAENIKDITADQQGLEKVLNFLRDNTGTNMDVRWKALEAAGIDRNTPVTISLHDVPFSKALSTILAQVGGSANLGYTVDDGVITISTRDDLNASVQPLLITYDVRDLLIQPDNQIPPLLDLNQATQQGQAGGGGGGSLFQQQQTQVQPQDQQNQIVAQIETAIKTVDPNSWVDAGGSVGAINQFNGMLLIRQTPENHYKIEHDILAKLREAHAVQISIEARIMFVSNEFFEQFGIGWNATIPAGALGSFQTGAIGLSNNNPATTVTSLVGGTLTNNTFNTANSAGLSASGTFGNIILDNFQLSLLLQATQADVRTVSLSAPRITLFNGQQAYVQVAQEQSYISNFNQTISPGTINSAALTSTTLTTSILNTGVQLLVTAAVSDDRRYVIMQATPTLTTNEGFTDIGSIGASTTSTTLQGIFLQLPKIDVTTVHTNVSVPDGGTLLIGGEKVVGTTEVELGVPILSQIPGLNRLFTNRAMEKDEKTLLILIRPKIIIQKEIEQNLFGVGYDRPTGLPTNPAGPSMTVGNGIDPGYRAEGQ